jgi:hypothetical protein
MAIIGDLILRTRSAIPDMPPSLPVPFPGQNQAVITVANYAHFQYLFTTVNNYTPAISAVIPYSGGSNPLFNGNYTVVEIVGQNSFIATGATVQSGGSTGGELGTGVLVSIAASGSSTLPIGNYYVVVTQRNPWGETAGSGEYGPFTIAGSQALLITSPLLPSAVAIRAYLTLANGDSGSEIQFAESTTTPFTISSPPTGFGTPPTQSSAYLMDSDGPQFSVATTYQWLNEALNKFTRACGGLLDYSGVPTVAGQGMYVPLGEWAEITDVWYGGYWVKGGKRAEYFRRNTVTSSILSSVTVSVFTNKQVIEVNLQPDRNSGVTATTANMVTAADTSVAIANTEVFLLPFGFVQIGTEICAYYSLANGLISSLIRGLGSTIAQAWPSGTTVTELSLFWCGKRLTNNMYQPGNALSELLAPQGWAAIIPNYMLAQAKKAELDLESSKALEDIFYKEIESWMRANKGVATRVQAGGNTSTVVYDAVLGQGIVIPG